MALRDWSLLGLLLTPPMQLTWWYGWRPAFRVGGVYVVWTRRYHYPSLVQTTDVLHVGQAADIAARLDDHARAHEARYPLPIGRPDLCRAWAIVNPFLRDGVERYVGNRLCPGGVYPDGTPVPVTLPTLL